MFTIAGVVNTDCGLNSSDWGKSNPLVSIVLEQNGSGTNCGFFFT